MRLLSWLGLVLFFLLFLGYFFYGLEPVSAQVGENNETSVMSTSSVQFTITKGEAFKAIGSDLSQNSLIRSIVSFKLYSLLVGKAHTFQPGTYSLTRTMSAPQIVEVLTEGGKDDVSVTIPEGYTVKDIDATLHNAGVLAQNDSLITYDPTIIFSKYPELQGTTSLEGLLFPDTYRFKLNSTSDEVVKTFLDTFMEKAWPLLKTQDQNTWYDKLILASFLEREVSSLNDREIVAGILLKRYALHMPLQVDATVTYVKCGGAFKNCNDKTVTKNDTLANSPYNTYQNLGWTPTPISNPGRLAIEAALAPIQTPYFYYLSSKNTGETIFSKTLEEHNANRAKYL